MSYDRASEWDLSGSLNIPDLPDPSIVANCHVTSWVIVWAQNVHVITNYSVILTRTTFRQHNSLKSLRRLVLALQKLASETRITRITFEIQVVLSKMLLNHWSPRFDFMRDDSRKPVRHPSMKAMSIRAEFNVAASHHTLFSFWVLCAELKNIRERRLQKLDIYVIRESDYDLWEPIVRSIALRHCSLGDSVGPLIAN